MLYSKAKSIHNNSVIPAELAIAPDHPLKKNLELPIPGLDRASESEIREIQLRDRIPGIVKRLVPFDAETTWEYWWVVPGRMLLPEDIELLHADRDRVETIVAKLVSLFGGYHFEQSTQRDRDLEPVYDWQQIVSQAGKLGFQTYLLDIDYLPIAIKPHYIDVQTFNGNGCECVAVEPAHWHVEFFQLHPIDGGCTIQEPKPLCSCQIWTGKPFIRNQKTGKSTIRYDLWVGKPLDITCPSWRHSTDAIAGRSQICP